MTQRRPGRRRSLTVRLLRWPALVGGIGVATIVAVAAATGRDLLWPAIGGVALVVALLAAMAHAVDRRILRRLARIERHMAMVAGSGEFTTIAADPDRDAIAALSTALDAMVGRLHDRSGQRELRSFDLGRAESRTAMAHNIRNALSPISAILSHGLAQPAIAERRMVERAVTELGHADLAPERRAMLVGYVMAAIDAAARARGERLAQFETGRTALANVLDIVGEPPAGAGAGMVRERCDVTDLIARHGAIARYGGGQSIAVSFPARPCWIWAGRVLLGQVIGNLFRNAAEAIGARPGEGGQIVVTLARGPDTVTVIIVDDGEGFMPDAAPILFQRGVSTRRTRSGGLGLHWCANAVATMGGSLRLESDGPGLGARALLTLPIVHETGD